MPAPNGSIYQSTPNKGQRTRRFVMRLRRILMERDGLTKEEAEREIDEARELLQEYLEEGQMEEAENICEEMWGLEPDYIMELI